MSTSTGNASPRAGFVEPAGRENAGTMDVRRPPTSYERFMAAEGVPVHRGAGFRDVRDLELADWSRIGGRGAFLVLDQTVDVLGLQVVEIAPGGALEPQQGMFETRVLVVEGAGTTEFWSTPATRPRRFEWRAGALFAIPMNLTYRLVNATRERVLLLVGNTSPMAVNIYDDLAFVFANPYRFPARYSEDPAYFTPSTELLATQETRRAMWRTNVISDVVGCALPLDNQRSPGYRRIEPHMAGGYFWNFVGEHMPGRYSKAHAHTSGAVLICLRGSGYTLNWPIECGPRPWADGHADRVERIDYVPGGLVAAAPGGGEWFHQHFGGSADPLRFLVLFGGAPGSQYADYAGRGGGTRTWLNADIEDGGRSIGYRSEDPWVRREFEHTLARSGVASQMTDEMYA